MVIAGEGNEAPLKSLLSPCEMTVAQQPSGFPWTQ